MKTTMKFSACVLTLFVVGMFLPGITSKVIAQSGNYELTISDISYEKVYKNWLFIPTQVDLRVDWQLVPRRPVVEGTGAAEQPEHFRAFLIDEREQKPVFTRDVSGATFAIFPGIKVGSKFFVKVEALDAGENPVAESGTATIVVGNGESSFGGPGLGQNWMYYLHPGRWQLASVGKANIYDRSTALGKLAFVFLSITCVLSLLVLVFYSSRTLYLGNVFPYKRSKKDLLWSFTLSCDKSYENRLTNKFKFVLKAWETIASRSRSVADEAVKNIPQTLSSTEKMASVDVACMEYWTHDGDKAIGTIGDILSFPQNQQEKTNPNDMLTDLVVKIEDSFHDLIRDDQVNGNGSYRNGNGVSQHTKLQKENIEELINEIYEPVELDEKPFSRFRKWLLRKGVFDMKKGLEPFPTSKIIRAGLEIHRLNGYRWLKPTEEVKRAFEDRASTEIETLRRKSKIDWFWNYGALAPLVGLFGTVTGITYAFQQLSKANMNPDFANTIQMLSNGIFEALWTTIFGLANGIVFVIIYYYYKHKLDWIYAKWEEIYVHITEKL